MKRLLSGLLILFTIGIHAEVPGVFRHLTVNDGLPQNSPRAMICDAIGRIWIGTESGIGCYNGLSFTVFRHDASNAVSLSNNYINCLEALPNGDVLVGTDGSGVDWYRNSTNGFVHFNMTGTDEWAQRCNYIYSLLYHRGIVYAGTANGVFAWNIHTKKAFRIAQHRNNHYTVIKSLCAGARGQVLLGTESHVLIFKNKIDTLIQNVSPSCIMRYGEQTYLLSNEEGGLYSFNIKNRHQSLFFSTQQNEKGDAFNDIAIGADKSIWLAGDTSGLWHLSPDGTALGHFIRSRNNESLSDNRLQSLLLAPGNVLFAGTAYSGINILNTQAQPIRSWSESPDQRTSFNPAGPICEGHDNVWYIGTLNGLILFDQRNGITKSFTNENQMGRLPDNMVTTLLNVDDFMFVGTDGGCAILNEKTKIMQPIQFSTSQEMLQSVSVWSLFRSNDSTIYIGTWGDGLFHLQKNTKTSDWESTAIQIENTPANIITISSLNSDTLLLGTWGDGLIAFHRQRGEIRTFNVASGGSSIIMSIAKDQMGHVFAGSTDRGVFMLDQTLKPILHFHSSNVMSNNTVVSMLADQKGRIWCGTVNGLNCFDPNKNQIGIFTADDGLQSNEFSQWGLSESHDGHILVAGTNGVSSFHPDSLKEDDLLVTPVLEEISVMKRGSDASMRPIRNHEYQEKGVLEFGWNVKAIAFSFMTPDYRNPQKTRYSYRLRGFSDVWSTASNNRNIQFTNLSAGDYELCVRSSGVNGGWNPTETRIAFTIRPPFWKTIPFYISSIILLLLIVLFVIRIREKQLRKTNRILEHKVDERTREVVAQRDVIAEKNKEILDSITYAKRIQDALLPAPELISSIFPESFVWYKPRDIVSGDFYWFSKSSDEQKIIFTAIDCTGHGVPGAFMTVFAYNLMSRAINEKHLSSPKDILGFISEGLREMLWERYSDDHIRDGMNIAMCTLDPVAKTLTYAGAYHHLYLVSNGNLLEFKADKHPIGEPFQEYERSYKEHHINVNVGDCIYLFTDGIPDQFGGPNQKKYSVTRLRNFLSTISNHKASEQILQIEKELQSWQINTAQIDDMLLMGIRFE